MQFSSETFAPQLGVSRAALNSAAYATLYQGCGTCLDCGNKIDTPGPPLPLAAVSVRVHCFEPSQMNLELVTRARDIVLPANASSSGHAMTPTTPTYAWHVHRLAFTDKSGVVSFSKACQNEGCSLDGGNGNGTEQVCARDSLASDSGCAPDRAPYLFKLFVCAVCRRDRYPQCLLMSKWRLGA
jgi:hypothetical protein